MAWNSWRLAFFAGLRVVVATSVVTIAHVDAHADEARGAAVRGEYGRSAGVEIFVGKNLCITNNAFYIASDGNSAMQVNQNRGTVADLHLTGNYADGGDCTVNWRTCRGRR
ncbi:MAG TPA: hypothetical protein VIJ96_13485 [Acidothermaceae bacterium]